MDMYVAIKIFRAAPFYRDSAYEEARILVNLLKIQKDKRIIEDYENQTGQKTDEVNLVRMLNCFVHSGSAGNHCCIVLELLGPSLSTVIAEYNTVV